jgi:hypothetical protein
MVYQKPNRDELKAEALARTARHDGHRLYPSRQCVEDRDLPGLVCEEAGIERLGGQLDMVPRLGGDGGVDTYINTKFGRFRIDFKGARIPRYLAVPVYTLMKPENKHTIYVLGAIRDEHLGPDKMWCELIGWESAPVLRRAPTKMFEGYTILNHIIPSGRYCGDPNELRDLSELDEVRIDARMEMG